MLIDKLPTVRKIAQLLGTFTSTFPAVQYARLHYRALEHDKIMYLKNALVKKCLYHLWRKVVYCGWFKIFTMFLAQ